MEQFILWSSFVFAMSVLAVLAREDWFHLSRPARRVTARVVGYRAQVDEGSRSYAPLLEFADENGKPVQVNDIVYSPLPGRGTGSMVEITHPQGMPNRARINRPLLRAAIYLVLLFMVAVLVGRLSGWLSVGGGEMARL